MTPADGRTRDAGQDGLRSAIGTAALYALLHLQTDKGPFSGNAAVEIADALLPVVAAHVEAEKRAAAAEALETAARAFDYGVDLDDEDVGAWLRGRADALERASRGSVTAEPYPCYCLPGAPRCDDPWNWCDRAAALRGTATREAPETPPDAPPRREQAPPVHERTRDE